MVAFCPYEVDAFALELLQCRDLVLVEGPLGYDQYERDGMIIKSAQVRVGRE